MSTMYLMDKLREKFGEEQEDDIQEKELNYKVGNTSGLDVTQQIPSELAERVGQLAQRGGGEMEIKVANPTSFSIDREGLYSTVQQLGIDISFHSDPNIGYTSPYRTGQGRGFNPTHEYFTQYLQELASFKTEKEHRDDLDFRIGRVNPHISTDQVPALKERMAQDVSLDPFGYDSSDFSEQTRKMRDETGRNMFRNKDFLGKLYYTLFLRESRFPFELYQSFAGYSDDFDKVWRHARHEACWNLIQEETSDILETRVKQKLLTSATVVNTDRGVSLNWDQITTGEEIPLSRSLTYQPSDDEEPEGIESLSELIDIEEPQPLQPLQREKMRPFSFLTDLNTFSRQFSNLKDLSEEMLEEGYAYEVILEALDEAFDMLWRVPNSKDQVDSANISVEAKLNGLQRHLEIQQLRILERAYKIGKDREYKVNGKEGDIDKAAELVFKGYEEMYAEDRQKTPEQLHLDLLKRLFERQNFQRMLRMESVIFYSILPAWMSEASKPFKDGSGRLVHKGWEAPEFIWDALVERKWGEENLNHWNGDLSNWESYFKELETNAEFRRDVAAASASIYVWGHFTQVKSDFEFAHSFKEDSGRYTWVEWMNKYGIGVNMEAMNGDPNSQFKLWRPRDIVTACRAVNITARSQLDSVNDVLDDCPLKFTIDMEHTASFGVDPWEEMEALIEHEKWLADSDYDVPADTSRPLAKMVRMYHLTKPGHETTQGTGHLHGPFRFGDMQLYRWLYNMVEAGFAQADERASVMYEVGGEMTGTVQKAKLSMNMIEIGLEPEKVDPARVDPDSEYRDEEEALIARFFGMDRPSYNREWAKIEEHAFDPLKGLLEATEFDYTYTSSAALQNENRPQEWEQEKYR